MAEQSRKLNGQMCWLWCGGMNPAHGCCLDLSALQRNGALVFGARSTDRGPCVGTVPGRYSCAGPFECSGCSCVVRNQESRWDLGEAEVVAVPGWSFHTASLLYSSLRLFAVPGSA